MPAIGDQVASLELDHSDALAKIDALNSTNAALTSANASLIAENAALNKYADEIKAMVESVASGALAMLQAARAPIVAEIASIAKTAVTDVKVAVAAVETKVTSLFDNQPAAVTVEPAAIVTSDSGDEQPAPLTEPAPPIAPAIVPPANSWTARVESAVETDLAALEVEITKVPEAVDRMLHHSSAPPVTTIRAPVDMTMHVDHDEGGLPMFLRAGTTFDALARRDYLR